MNSACGNGIPDFDPRDPRPQAPVTATPKRLSRRNPAQKNLTFQHKRTSTRPTRLPFLLTDAGYGAPIAKKMLKKSPKKSPMNDDE
jgi:hypothetical protein